MKKIIVGWLVTSSLIGLSATAFAATTVATIQERNSNQKLIYAQDGSQLVFTLVNGDIEKEVKRLAFDISKNSLEITGDNDRYSFDFVKKMTAVSGKAYDWCWSSGRIQGDFGGEPIEMIPAIVGLPLAPATIALCATVPGVPFIVGILAAPVDGVITLSDHLFDADTIAARKFSRLISGKDQKASKKVFRSLVRQISNLD